MRSLRYRGTLGSQASPIITVSGGLLLNVCVDIQVYQSRTAAVLSVMITLSSPIERGAYFRVNLRSIALHSIGIPVFRGGAPSFLLLGRRAFLM